MKDTLYNKSYDLTANAWGNAPSSNMGTTHYVDDEKHDSKKANSSRFA